jgi:TPR repeat protein
MISAGKCYRDGDGVEKDLNKAREYFQKASDLGSIEAAQLLNDCK